MEVLTQIQSRAGAHDETGRVYLCVSSLATPNMRPLLVIARRPPTPLAGQALGPAGDRVCPTSVALLALAPVLLPGVLPEHLSPHAVQGMPYLFCGGDGKLQSYVFGRTDAVLGLARPIEPTLC